MKYGDEQILSEVVANFMGKSKPSRSKQLRAKRLQAEHVNLRHLRPIPVFQTTKSVRWPSKDIPLLSLESRLKRTNDPTKRKELTSKLEEMKKNRAYLDAHTRELIKNFNMYLTFQTPLSKDCSETSQRMYAKQFCRKSLKRFTTWRAIIKVCSLQKPVFISNFSFDCISQRVLQFGTQLICSECCRTLK